MVCVCYRSEFMNPLEHNANSKDGNFVCNICKRVFTNVCSGYIRKCICLNLQAVLAKYVVHNSGKKNLFIFLLYFNINLNLIMLLC